ncbi:MAG TPA: GGDEF domain-containing protein [Rhodocyclaceae bacterium]|jgi:diguanylate cyclase (GGDEF)-like protein|nr:GGDEF domain-containing protein [Rhodocyclaceae bacterium]
MNDIATSLFSNEENLADASRAFLAACALTPEANDAFAQLLAGYERLLRETKQLVKLSDRKENELTLLNRKLKQLTQSLAYQAEHDAMTGCLNKSAMTARVNSRMQSASVCLILLDLDHFKRINDVHGHPAGDAVLRGVADLFHERAGDNDWVGRMGGEEFSIMLPQCDLQKGFAFADALRHVVAETDLQGSDQPLRITLSAGIAVSKANESFDDLYRRADVALYSAKRGGRNRVVAHE